MSDLSEQINSNQAVTTTPTQQFDEAGFTAVKGIILNLSVKLDELKAKQKEYRERLKNLFDNDSQLSTYEEQAAEAAQAFKKRKKELQDSVEGKQVQAKMKELSEELRDIEESLTNHLLSYYQITGTQSFDTPTGDEREFRLSARLLPIKQN